MSLEIQDNFASRYAKYSWNPDNWQVAPHQINHIVQDWWEKLAKEMPYLFPTEYYENPKPERIVREIFGKFFASLKRRNHVHIPKKVQEASIREYLED